MSFNPVGIDASNRFPIAVETRLASELGIGGYQDKVSKALMPARVGLSRASVAPFDMMNVGDSITEGQTSSNEANRWTVILMNLLRARFQPAGVVGGEGYRPAWYNAPNLTDPFSRTPGSGAITEGSAWGLGFRRLTLAGDTFANQHVDTTFTGTGIDVFFTRGSGTGTARMDIDGAQAATLNTNNASTLDGQYQQIRGLSAASHALSVGRSTGGTQILFPGVMVYNGDESVGVRRWDHSKAGSVSADFAPATDYHAPYFSYIQPDLVTIGLGANDVNTGVPVATYKANLVTLVNRINAQVTVPPSIVLISHWPRIANPASPQPSIDAWAPYRQALAEVAAAYGNVVIFDAWRYFAYTVYGGDALTLYSDGIHLADNGAKLLAQGLFQFIVGSGV